MSIPRVTALGETVENPNFYAKNKIFHVEIFFTFVVAEAIVIATTFGGWAEEMMHRLKSIFLKDNQMHNVVFSMRSVAAIAALALSGSAFAAGQDAQAGQTAFKDPVTGKFRNPTALEARQLNDLRAAQRAADASARKASGAPQAGVVRLQKNGVVAAFLDDESISYSVMKRNAAGELVLECVTGATAVEKTLSTPATTESKEHQHEVQ